MAKFLKNKAIGYYLAFAAAVLALIFIPIFFGTLGTSMPNSAASKTPQTIGIFMIAGLVAQICVLVLPEYGIIQAVALVLFGFSFYKELICCPQVLAAIVTGVAYEGGSLPAHLTFIILEVLIFGLAIAGAFLGYFNKDEDTADAMKFKKDGELNVPTVARISGVGVALVAAVLVSSLVATSMEGAQVGGPTKPVKPSPITEEIKAQAEAYVYDFDPTEVHFIKDDFADADGNFDFSSAAGISSLPTNGQRDGVNLVYKFEGSYAEGWQGDYSKTYAYLFLWEDGKFAGTSGSTQFRGYWYDNGDGSTLVMVTSNNPDGQIIAYEQTGFYSWIVDLNSSVNGGRRIKATGYLYYPEVALFIDTAETDLKAIKVGDNLDVSGWTAQRVLKNLKYSSCYEDNSHKVAWKVNGANISNSTVNITESGEYDISATWGELEAHCVINVD